MFRRHPRGPVPVERALEIVAGELGQLVAGMEPVRTGLWAGPLSDRHWSTLRIVPHESGVTILEYGVGCSWVPDPGCEGFPWQRAPFEARPTLWVDHLTAGSPFPHEIDMLSGEDVLRRTARNAVRHTIPHAGDWWSAVATPEGVLREACRQASDERSRAHPHPGYVAAFTLAGLGRLDDAEAELGRAGVVRPAESMAATLVLLRDVADSLTVH